MLWGLYDPPVTDIDQPASETEATAQPSRGIYRGWPIAGVSFLSLGVVLGTAQFAFGVFILPLQNQFGWSRTQVNASLTFGVISALAAPIMGRLLDRFGARWLMGGSLAIVALGFLLRAAMTNLWQFYVFSALIFAGSSGVTNLPTGRLVTLWFSKTRGRMMGFVTAGNNFGGMISVPLVAALIVAAGWRTSFAVIGLVVLVIMVLVIAIVRDRPEDVEREVGKRWAPPGQGGQSARRSLEGFSANEALRMRAFWLLLAGMAMQQFARTAVATQLVPYLEGVGFSTGTAALAVSLLAFFAMSSKIIFGRMSESITAIYSYVVIVAIQVVGLAILAVVGGSALAWLGLMVFGLGMGGVGALGPLAITETFGLRNFGSIMGLTRVATILPLVLGPIMAGLIFDSRGSYFWDFIATIALLSASLVCFFLAAPRWSRTPSFAGR